MAVEGTVTATAALRAYDTASRRVFFDAARAEPDGYFDQGRLEWTSGANAGLQGQVKSYAGGQFVLWEPMISNIAVGDGYRVRPGCDKTASTCAVKFGNIANFGGFPHVPGRDAISKTPDSKG
jgi:uncharacterized phage protein (TIGR02218 family)